MSFPALRKWIAQFFSLTVILLMIPGCSERPTLAHNLPDLTPERTVVYPVAAVATPSLQPTAANTTAPQIQFPRLFLPTYLPQRFREAFHLPAQVEQVKDEKTANLRLKIPSAGTKSTALLATHWVYALVAAFPTTLDHVSTADLEKAWRGEAGGALGKTPLLVDSETRQALEAWLGPANPGSVQVAATADLLDRAWKEQPIWAIIPFETIQPRWKVLRINGQSPLDNTFQAEEYPLAVRIELWAEEGVQNTQALSLPTNRDPQKLTVLVMTGVTALSRHIGEAMENKGVTYPARDIGDALAAADLTHISNEVSFYQSCPKPGPARADMRFCSNPKYIELLEKVGTDIVELTGNHNLDWGNQPFLDTLDLYRQRGWKTFGGGKNVEDARKALLIEHNGNKLAFIGCSPAGPEPVWATVDKPGSAPCNLERMEQQVRDLIAQGYLPIVTFQAVETDVYLPPPAQAVPDFRRMARAGAVVVSGSQSHVPQTMTFVGESFVHYGLGNLFFDQMKPPEARQAFIDRHTFYAGKYLGVELLTTLLEESARPRPMTTRERDSFLQKIFALCDWSGN